MPLWTTPQLWIDFSDTTTLFDATTDGNQVTNGVGIARAEDKSGNGRHFTQSVSGSRPTWIDDVTNGLGVARFDGGDILTTTSAKSAFNFLHSGPSTIFIVIKNGITDNPGTLYGWMGSNGGSSSNRGVYYCYDDRNLFTGMTDSFNGLCSPNAPGAWRTVNLAASAVLEDFRNIVIPNRFGMFTIKSDPGNATLSLRGKIAVNGGQLVGNNETNASLSSSDSTFDLQIGSLGNNLLPLVGDYCELVLYNSILSIEEQQLVEGYLSWKRGLQDLLPAGHAHKEIPPGGSLKGKVRGRIKIR